MRLWQSVFCQTLKSAARIIQLASIISTDVRGFLSTSLCNLHVVNWLQMVKDRDTVRIFNELLKLQYVL